MVKRQKPSVQQEAIYKYVEEGSGNVIVEAVAGSGKTTTIIGSLKYMQGSIQLTAFNKKMAEELSERTEKFHNVKCNTFHSIGLYALKNSNMNSRFNIDNWKVSKIFKELDLIPKEYSNMICQMVSLAKINGFGIKTKTNDFYKISDFRGWAGILLDHGIVTSLPDVTGIDHERYGIVLEHGKYMPKKVLVQTAIEVLKESNKDVENIDFDDMLYMPLLFDLRFRQYDWFIIDEAQDTSLVRIEVAKRSLKPNGRLFAVGDTYQAIYFFAGASNSAMEEIKNEFECKEFPLSCCYRCDKDIITEAQKINPNIEAHESKGSGVVRTENTISYVYDNVKIGDAVLCRLTAPLVKLAFDLNARGIPAKVEGKNQAEKYKRAIFNVKANSMKQLRINISKILTGLYVEYVESNNNIFVREKLMDAMEKYSVIRVFYEEALRLGITSTQEFMPYIEKIFEDFEASKEFVNLMTVHRSKGLEFGKVFILHAKETMPLPRYKDEDSIQYKQEMNLKYVAITRAENELVIVNNPIVQQEINSLYSEFVTANWAEYPDLEKVA